MRFGQFIQFMFDVNDYILAVRSIAWHPFALNVPPSQRWEMAFRYLVPLIVVVVNMCFFLSVREGCTSPVSGGN